MRRVVENSTKFMMTVRFKTLEIFPRILKKFFQFPSDSTAQMLETYMNEVQNFDVNNIETSDAQTNTEFLPEYQQQRNAMMRLRDRVGSASTTSLRDPTIYPVEDRSSLVKRSQTFSPSAVTASKSRYICRRSDSDSAMHFNITAAVAAQPHPFRRGAVERRSLRYHSKVPRLPSTSEFTEI
jgi:hypothetical protein